MPSGGKISQPAEDEFQWSLRRGAYIEISLSCRDVPRLDITSKSDPFCIVFSKVKLGEGEKGPEWRRVGQTETIYDTHEAAWTQKFPAKADDGTIYRFDCYDRDSNREVLADHDFIGCVKEIRLVDVLQAKGKALDLPLRRKSDKKAYGTLRIAVDAIVVKTPNIAIQLQVACNSKERSKFFYEISRKMPHGAFHPVYRSELLEKKECYFANTTLKISSLAASNFQRPMRLGLFKFYPMGRSVAAGTIDFCLADLNSQSNPISWQQTKSGIKAEVKLESPEMPGSPDMRVYRFIINCR